MTIKKRVILFYLGSMGAELPQGAFVFIGTVYTESLFDKRKRIQIHHTPFSGVFRGSEEKRTVGLLGRKKIAIKGMRQKFPALMDSIPCLKENIPGCSGNFVNGCAVQKELWIVGEKHRNNRHDPTSLGYGPLCPGALEIHSGGSPPSLLPRQTKGFRLSRDPSHHNPFA
jgi:hypothetical protein